MNGLSISLSGNRRHFRPGETVEGVASWELDKVPKWIEARLYWRAYGAGSQDVGVAGVTRFDGAARGQREFRFMLPEAPYSFTGKLVSLSWGIEVVAEPGSISITVEFSMSPTGEPIALYK